MLFAISPAKALDYETPPQTATHTEPLFVPQAAALIKTLKAFGPTEVSDLMGLSDKLAALNVARYQAWTKTFTPKNAKQAVLAFDGDVYDGLSAKTLTTKQLDWLQDHLCILSGLYGVLRPLDLMQPYRLEMGTVYANPAGKDLYAFWGDRLAHSIEKDLNKEQASTVVNLASNEYSKAARLSQVNASVISPVFKDEKNGKFKIISFYAKRARGLMANYIITNQIMNPSELQKFSAEGYAFSPEQSDPLKPVFLRKESNRAAA